MATFTVGISLRSRVWAKTGHADIGGGVICILDHSAVSRVARQVKRAQRGEPWARASQRDIAAAWKALTPSEKSLIVELSVREIDPESNEVKCDLEFTPLLEGAILMMEGGRVRAMAGGAKNRYFNRATDAKRQFGSIWKVLIYEAALELGWTLGEKLITESMHSVRGSVIRDRIMNPTVCGYEHRRHQVGEPCFGLVALSPRR